MQTQLAHRDHPAVGRIGIVTLLMRMAGALRTRRLQARRRNVIYGNPLHEAWDADGEPLDRETPAQHARHVSSRYLVTPHGLSR
jgi:hypothetical protein